MSITNLEYDGEIWYTFDKVCDTCCIVIYTKGEIKQTSDPTKNQFYMKNGSLCLVCLHELVDK